MRASVNACVMVCGRWVCGQQRVVLDVGREQQRHQFHCRIHSDRCMPTDQHAIVYCQRTHSFLKVSGTISQKVPRARHAPSMATTRTAGLGSIRPDINAECWRAASSSISAWLVDDGVCGVCERTANQQHTRKKKAKKEKRKKKKRKKSTFQKFDHF